MQQWAVDSFGNRRRIRVRKARGTAAAALDFTKNSGLFHSPAPRIGLLDLFREAGPEHCLPPVQGRKAFLFPHPAHQPAVQTLKLQKRLLQTAVQGSAGQQALPQIRPFPA